MKYYFISCFILWCVKLKTFRKLVVTMIKLRLHPCTERSNFRRMAIGIVGVSATRSSRFAEKYLWSESAGCAHLRERISQLSRPTLSMRILIVYKSPGLSISGSFWTFPQKCARLVLPPSLLNSDAQNRQWDALENTRYPCHSIVTSRIDYIQECFPKNT